MLETEFIVELYLYDIKNVEKPMPRIQIFSQRLKTGINYQPYDQQDVLFILNKQSSILEIQKLQNLCESQKLNPNFYDLSFRGDLNLFEPRLPGKSLAEDLRGKILVIIDQPFNISDDSN